MFNVNETLKSPSKTRLILKCTSSLNFEINFLEFLLENCFRRYLRQPFTVNSNSVIVECEIKVPFNWSFLHDTTKIQTRKVLILLRFYFHELS